MASSPELGFVPGTEPTWVTLGWGALWALWTFSPSPEGPRANLPHPTSWKSSFNRLSSASPHRKRLIKRQTCCLDDRDRWSLCRACPWIGAWCLFSSLLPESLFTSEINSTRAPSPPPQIGASGCMAGSGPGLLRATHEYSTTSQSDNLTEDWGRKDSF